MNAEFGHFDSQFAIYIKGKYSCYDVHHEPLDHQR